MDDLIVFITGIYYFAFHLVAGFMTILIIYSAFQIGIGYALTTFVVASIGYWFASMVPYIGPAVYAVWVFHEAQKIGFVF